MIIEGLIQGLTEFLPISSSGHLALMQSIFGKGSIASTVLLHIGTLLAVLIFFKKEIINIMIGLTKGLQDPNAKLFFYIIIATIPAVITGLFLNDVVATVFNSSKVTFILLTINGVFIFATKFAKRNSQRINSLKAIIIGLYQAIAILPGISRSGATIAIGIYLGVNPMAAFRFSFLLSIPAIIGAGIFKMEGLSGSLAIAWPGFLISFISGLLTLFILRKIVVQRLFHIFGIYCIVIGIIGFIVF